MKFETKILTAVALLAVLTSSAQATITFVLGSGTVASGDNGVPTVFPNDAAAVQTATGVGPLTRLYRTDGAGPGNESGVAAHLSAYSVLFADGSTDISLIYDGVPTIISGYANLFLVTRANDTSAANPDWKIFNLTGWNGTETIFLDSVFSNPTTTPPTSMVITEINIYGGGTAVTAVAAPDGGVTILLLGTTLLGLAAFFRRQSV